MTALWSRRRKAILALIGLTSLISGRMAAMSACLFHGYSTPLATSRIEPNLRYQIQDQQHFQALLFDNQNRRCSGKSRYLLRDQIPPKDGFASEVQYIARLLQVATSTQRILWISDSWKSAYCPHDGGWTCLWHPLTNCTRPSLGGGGGSSRNRTLLDTILYPMSYGILPQRQRSPNTSLWFDPLLYSTRPILPAPTSFPLKHSTIVADVIPHWERAYGRYWIRSQMTHFLWKPVTWLQEEIEKRLSYPHDRPFIGMHVRFTDNIPDFAKGFGRNATFTRNLQHFLKRANTLSNEYQHRTGDRLRDIYIATDHAHVLYWARRLFVGWNVWGQEENVQRSTTQSRIWFARGRPSAAGAMAADLEVLRRADYLIGSFQSNVYRLATQLNTAWNVDRYSVRQLRHFTVDVEWFEDP